MNIKPPQDPNGTVTKSKRWKLIRGGAPYKTPRMSKREKRWGRESDETILFRGCNEPEPIIIPFRKIDRVKLPCSANIESIMCETPFEAREAIKQKWLDVINPVLETNKLKNIDTDIMYC